MTPVPINTQPSDLGDGPQAAFVDGPSVPVPSSQSEIESSNALDSATNPTATKPTPRLPWEAFYVEHDSKVVVAEEKFGDQEISNLRPIKYDRHAGVVAVVNLGPSGNWKPAMLQAINEAAFIVRACNAHDTFINVIETLLREAVPLGATGQVAISAICVHDLRAALAKARGEQR